MFVNGAISVRARARAPVKEIAIFFAVSVFDAIFRSSGKKALINFDKTLQLTAILFALLTTEEMMCSIIQGSTVRPTLLPPNGHFCIQQVAQFT